MFILTLKDIGFLIFMVIFITICIFLWRENKKMKKITLASIFAIIIVALLVIVLTACDNVIASIPNSFYSIERGRMDNDIRYTVLVDSETGVEYIYTASTYNSAMTPRYNADGSLCVFNGGAEG